MLDDVKLKSETEQLIISIFLTNKINILINKFIPFNSFSILFMSSVFSLYFIINLNETINNQHLNKDEHMSKSVGSIICYDVKVSGIDNIL